MYYGILAIIFCCSFKLLKKYLLDNLDIFLRYPLNHIIATITNLDKVVNDLYQLNLLSQNEVEAIKSTDRAIYHKMIAIMVSGTIINGDQNDFSKFTTYLQSYPVIKYLVQYWEKICKFSQWIKQYI